MIKIYEVASYARFRQVAVLRRLQYAWDFRPSTAFSFLSQLLLLRVH
jgi:hypothetical protein